MIRAQTAVIHLQRIVNASGGEKSQENPITEILVAILILQEKSENIRERKKQGLTVTQVKALARTRNINGKRSISQEKIYPKMKDIPRTKIAIKENRLIERKRGCEREEGIVKNVNFYSGFHYFYCF